MNISIDTFSPSYYDKKIQDLNQRFYLVLSELKKSYPRYKVYPKNPEYENIYSNDISNIEKINTDFFSLKKSLDQNSIRLNTVIKQKNELITNEKKINENLKKKLQELISGANSSSGMIDQKQTVYNNKMLDLGIFVVSVLGIIVFTFRK